MAKEHRSEVRAAALDSVVLASACLIGHAWQQPILRFADTVAGIAVGVAAAWLGLRLTGQRPVANQ